MSPKQKVFLLSGILALLGVSISVIIIAIGGGFSGPSPSITHPPTAADFMGSWPACSFRNYMTFL